MEAMHTKFADCILITSRAVRFLKSTGWFSLVEGENIFRFPQKSTDKQPNVSEHLSITICKIIIFEVFLN